MIPGPYSVCRISFPDEDSDAATYQTIRYGYDTAEQAFADFSALAEEQTIAIEDLVVIRFIDPETGEN